MWLVAIFADRVDAGRQLAADLQHLREADAVVFGIPRGGVVVAAEVARSLALPLAAVVVRKLGAPRHEEFAVGAIAEGVRILNPGVMRTGEVSEDEIARVEDRERAELERRIRLFGAATHEVAGRIAIVVDDGVATGATALAACQALRALGAERIVLAVPVAPKEWRPDAAIVDGYICPHRERLWAVGQFYTDFTQTSDEEVARLLARDLPDGG